ncbi:site-specific DNA-methyltransferase [Qipengyuania gaetbuli]|uniref:site-specific DNA-methyltransferase n=1 Tax=Qipengyuania gaetbuli TaxID=266952 RepID=UPI001CD7E47D|nr:site-specific DNA-methyltransferase [Qipengyuania gaetbuli]MCA0910999.1 site-specific DNA-methyltransferase [Qipengyuania gaetbuli]
MPELQFKGKEFVYNHHLTVPFRPLEMQADKGIGNARLDGNLIVHGDNLHALKALLPMYAGKIDCFYIDPPYNTGKDDWSYSDRVDAPMIKEWVNDNPINVDDKLRHDKWLTMMWPRVSLIRELLRPGGILFVSIDDNEVAAATLMLQELFGDRSHLGTIIWKNATDNNPTNVAVEHEYVLVFCHKRDEVEPVWKSPWSDLKEQMTAVGAKILDQSSDLEEAQASYSKWFRQHRSQLGPLAEYNRIDDGGIYTASRSVHNPGKEGYRWELENPLTGKPVPQPLMGYRFPEETRDKLLEQNRIIFSENEDQLIRLRLPLSDYREKMPSLIEIDGRRGANELRAIFPERKQAFKNPKTFTLIEWLLSYVTDQSAIIVDSFAGSGTTAHAVLELNRRDGGNRRFILAEGEDYADDLTAERVRRVISANDGGDESFTFCTLGAPVEMDAVLSGENLPTVYSIAGLLWHTATATPLEAASIAPAADIADGLHKLGTHGGRTYWLHYKPDLAWLKSGGAALSLSMARAVAATGEGNHLVFAPAKFVSRELLARERLDVDYAPLPFALYRLETA